jgi:AraC-like DNA-binding protein
MTMIAYTAVLLLLFVLLFAFYVFAKNRIINTKNLGLVKLIDETIKYKERYEQLRQVVEAHSADSKTSTSEIVDLKSLSSEALFQYLYADIREKRLYLDPLFDRQAVCDRYQLTAAQVGSAFAQGSDYDSVSDFVRGCRLEYACVLLKSTDMKIAEVVASSGFSRATTFNHDFKARYNLTPSEYRRR